MYNQMYTRDAQQQALGFLVSQTSHIETEVYNTKYADIQYRKLVPVDTSANPWAKSVTFFSTDKVGKADWFHHMAKDIPRADVVRQKFEHGLELAGVGYGYTIEELGQAAMTGQPLTADRALAATRASEEFLDGVALTGSTEKNWTGLINDPNVTVVDAPLDGDGGSPAFSDKTPDQVLRDVNSIITGVYVDSKTVEYANTLLLPVEIYASLATRRITGTAITIMQFLQQYNAFTAYTQQALTIMAVRGLETAGDGGVGRIVAYFRDPQVLKFHMPMEHHFLQPVPDGPISFMVPGIFRTGGLEIRRPGAVRYLDKILHPAYE